MELLLDNPDRELNYRRTAGIIVRLMLRDCVEPPEVYITYEHGDDWFRAVVPNDKAAHAFMHPNLYRMGESPERQAVFAVPENYTETNND